MKKKKRKNPPTHPIKPPKGRVLVGKSCYPKGCCNIHDGKEVDVSANMDLKTSRTHPPYHEDCDCVVTQQKPDVPCLICEMRITQTKKIALDLDVQRTIVDPETKKKVNVHREIRLCSACLVFLQQFITGLMEQGMWQTIVNHEMKDAPKIIVPGMKPPPNLMGGH